MGLKNKMGGRPCGGSRLLLWAANSRGATIMLALLTSSSPSPCLSRDLVSGGGSCGTGGGAGSAVFVPLLV